MKTLTELQRLKILSALKLGESLLNERNSTARQHLNTEDAIRIVENLKNTDTKLRDTTIYLE